MRRICLPIAAFLTLTSVSANAQTNPLGDLLGGAIRGAMQNSAKQEAQTQWSKVDQGIVNCLSRTLTPPPDQLAAQGILPSDPRLKPHIDKCRQIIATEQQQRDAAEQDRKQREERAQRDEQFRQESLKKQEQALQEEKRRQELAIKKLKDEIATLRADAVVKSVLEREGLTLLIAAKDTANMTRALEGHPKFNRLPEVCLPTGTSFASDNAFDAFIRMQVEQKIGSGFSVKSCHPPIGNRDFFAISAVMLDASTPDMQAEYLRGIKGQQFVTFLSISASDFAIYQHKRKDSAAVVERKIANGEDVFVFVSSTSVVQTVCVLSGEQMAPLQEVFQSRRADWGDVLKGGTISYRTANDADDAFVGFKRGTCGGMLLHTSVAAKVLDGIKRDGLKTELHPSIIASSEIASKLAEIRAKKADEERLIAEEKKNREEAARKAEDDQKRYEANRNRCKTKDVALNYFVSSCVVAGSVGRSDVDSQTLQQKQDTERNKLSDCPPEVLDAVARAGKQSARDAALKVSSLSVFQDGLAFQCKKVGGMALQ
jgi:hypothetical protein